MQIPRLEDNDGFDHIAEAINMIVCLLFNGIQVSFLLVMLMLGSTFNKLGSICLYTWDNGMDLAGRKRVIMDRSGKYPYLVRYYLLFCNRNDDALFNVFIHRIMKSDEDDLHDHPWGYFTCILSGGYNETVGTVKVNSETDENTSVNILSHTTEQHWRYPGFMQKVNDAHIHRLELGKDENTGNEVPCWTLFIPFRRTQGWGFYANKDGGGDGVVWQDSNEYIDAKRNSGKEDAEPEHTEDHTEEHTEDHIEEHIEEHTEEHTEEHIEEHIDEHTEDHIEEHTEEHTEDHIEEHTEDHTEKGNAKKEN
jgi:hypothetical protein